MAGKKEKKKVKEKQEFESLFEYYGFAKKDEREYPVVSGILGSPQSHEEVFVFGGKLLTKKFTLIK